METGKMMREWHELSLHATRTQDYKRPRPSRQRVGSQSWVVVADRPGPSCGDEPQISFMESSMGVF